MFAPSACLAGQFISASAALSSIETQIPVELGSHALSWKTSSFENPSIQSFHVARTSNDVESSFPLCAIPTSPVPNSTSIQIIQPHPSNSRADAVACPKASELHR